MSVAPHTARGSASIGVIIALAVLQLIVVGVVLGGARDQDLTTKRLAALRAQYAAEAGVNMAAREFALNADDDGDGMMGTISTKTALTQATFSVTKAVAGPTSTFTVSSASADAARRARLVGVESTPSSSTTQGVKFEAWTLTAAPSALASVPFGTTPTAAGWTPWVNVPNSSGAAFWQGGPNNRFGVRFSGKITIPTTGSWTFSLGSDDGSDLSINGATLINHDGAHSFSTRTGIITLAAGAHDFTVRYFENSGNNGCVLSWSGPGVPTTTVIPPTAFSTSLSGLAAVAATTTVAIAGEGTVLASTVNGYDSSLGLYGGANIDNTNSIVAVNATASNRFTMSSMARLLGSASVAPGGIPSSVISLSSGATISGTQTAGASNAAVAGRQGVPAVGSSSGNVTFSSGTTTIATDRYFNNLTISSTAVVNVTAPVYMRVDGNLTVSNSASLTIDTGGSLTMFVYGNVTLSNTSTVNINTGSSGRLRIIMMGNNRTIQLNDSSKLCAAAVGNTADLSLTGSGSPPCEFWGTFAGRAVSMTGRSLIHADLAGRTGSGGSGTRTVKFTSWAMVP
ncbi:MAG: PA14 domain-containing protein [Phycisphaerales bacterium]